MCDNRVTQQNPNLHLCLFKTFNGRGWGAKSLKAINTGSFVMEYTGELINFNEEKKRDFAFSAKIHVDAFVTGFNNYRHIYERVDCHQKTKIHKQSATAFMEMATHTNIKSKLFKEQLMLNNNIIMERRTILLKVIDIIKVIGKCGIGFRGSKYEAWNFSRNYIPLG